MKLDWVFLGLGLMVFGPFMMVSKEDPIKLQEVEEVAKLCRKVLFLPEELVPDSSLRKVIFVTTFGQAQVDPQLGGPNAFEA